jgi:hypothetical protein
MTTNVPQDVIDELEKISQDIAIAGINGFGNRISDAVSKLRAQRQQGAEPVAWQYYENGEWHNYVNNEHGKLAYESGGYVVRPLFESPPQGNALVAAAYRDAAEIANQFEATCASKKGLSPLAAETARLIKEEILAAIPADAEAALREVCMKVARKASGCGWSLGMESANPKESDLQAIVNSVLVEGKS